MFLLRKIYAVDFAKRGLWPIFAVHNTELILLYVEKIFLLSFGHGKDSASFQHSFLSNLIMLASTYKAREMTNVRDAKNELKSVSFI